MIPRFKPNYNHEEMISIIENKDDAVKSFEEKFATTVNHKFAVSFPSGRSGLFSVFKALDIRGGEVVIPSYSCIVVPSATIAAGCNPRFVDISLSDYNMIIDKTASVFNEKTIAIIPTHMYGFPVNVQRLRDIVGENILIIEDAAQALLTKNVGKFGDATFYSFNYEKQLFTFGGGVVTTNNDEIYEKLVRIKNEFFSKNKFNHRFRKTSSLFFTRLIFSDLFFYLFSNLWEKRATSYWEKNCWDIQNIDLPVDKIYLSQYSNDTFSDIQAAVGLIQLDKIKMDIKNRYEIAKFYDSKLKDVQNLYLPPLSRDCSYAHYTFQTKNREHFESFMKKRKIQINKVFEYSIPHIPRFRQYVNKGESFPNSMVAGNRNVNLPIYPQLIKRPYKLEKIAEAVKSYYEKYD
jgi:perosamine synthetase